MPDREATLVTPSLLRDWPLASPEGSKYARGQVLVVGGARCTPGAAMLAGIASLRVGAGRLSLAVGESVAALVAVNLVESGTVPLAEDEGGAISGHHAGRALARELARADALLVGPGLDDADGSARLLEEVVAETPGELPVLLDAFGATVLPDVDAKTREALVGRLALSPNGGELARLLGLDETPHDLAAATIECARRYGAVVGCGEWVASFDGELWRMTAGDVGLGTSGSGDVVAGAMVGLMARGATLTQSVVWAKHLHATAGEMLAARVGRVGFLAREVCDELPVALNILGGD